MDAEGAMNDETSGAVHRLIAVYGSRAEAEAVRTMLTVAGVDPAAVEVARAAPAGTDGFTDDFATKSFWGRIKDLASIPRHTGHAYEDAIDSGHAIVMLSPPESSLHRIVALLESTNPIEFDGRPGSVPPSAGDPSI
jgi:hypothetical protein